MSNRTELVLITDHYTTIELPEQEVVKVVVSRPAGTIEYYATALEASKLKENVNMVHPFEVQQLELKDALEIVTPNYSTLRWLNLMNHRGVPCRYTEEDEDGTVVIRYFVTVNHGSALPFEVEISGEEVIRLLQQI